MVKARTSAAMSRARCIVVDYNAGVLVRDRRAAIANASKLL